MSVIKAIGKCKVRVSKIIKTSKQINIEEIEDILCYEAINEICQSGSNDEAVEKWTDYYLNQILNINSNWVDYVNMLENYGFEIAGSMRECLERSVWIAAWNVFDSDRFNDFIEKVEKN